MASGGIHCPCLKMIEPSCPYTKQGKYAPEVEDGLRRRSKREQMSTVATQHGVGVSCSLTRRYAALVSRDG